MDTTNRPPMRILLIDDDGDVRHSIANFLSARGHVILQTDNGATALSHRQMRLLK